MPPPAERKIYAFQGKTLRWANMPGGIPVFIKPFHWYQDEKEQQAEHYEAMARKAFLRWESAAKGRFQIRFVDAPPRDGITLFWARVSNRSLGWCKLDENPLTQQDGIIRRARLKISISDGDMHGWYDKQDWVYRVLLHEIGHAWGVDHTDDRNDIMSGIGINDWITELSETDIRTLHWIYDQPPHFNYLEKGRALKLKTPEAMHYVALAMTDPKRLSSLQKTDSATPQNKTIILPQPIIDPTRLEADQDILCELGQYYLRTQLPKSSASGNSPPHPKPI